MASIDNQIVDILLKADIKPQPLSIERQPQRNLQMHGADEAMAGGAIASQTPQGGEAIKSEPVKAKNGVEVTVRQKTQLNADENHVGNAPTPSAFGHVGRNDACPCGAKHDDGRPIKFKHCHGR